MPGNKRPSRLFVLEKKRGHPAQAARAALKPQNMVVFDKVFPIYRKRVSLPPFGGILVSQRR